MKVLMVEPGYAPYETELNGLREMQAAVGGTITAIYPYEERVALVCNDNAILEGLPFNRSVPDGYNGVCGNFFVCGLSEDDFCSLTQEQTKHYAKEFHHAEILLGANSAGLCTLKVSPKQKTARKPPEPPQR